MKNTETHKFFDAEKAASYDEQRAKLAPVKDALHLCMLAIFSELPAESRILCVGAGTGAELISLAQAYPQWHFTVVEPSPGMMKVCRQQAENYGIASRCAYHEGYLDSLPESDLFDGATAILVSQFMLQTEERIKFFSEIASRLRSGGYLVNADLASDMSSSEYKSLVDVWLAIHKYADIALNSDYLGRDVAVLPAKEIEAILVSSGFSRPVLFYQALLIHAWYSQVGQHTERYV